MTQDKTGGSRKFLITPKTLEDRMVRDGLEAVALLTDHVPYCIAGGMATQSYLPREYRRPTSDIDLSLGFAINYNTFKTIFSDVLNNLTSKGYNVDTSKKSTTYDLDIVGPDGTIVIEASRRSDSNFSENQERLLREIRNARRKIVEGGNGTIVVAAPEDIVSRKLIRIINGLRRNSFLRDSFDGYLKKIEEA